MATNDLDDMMPRPLPKPSQLEEVCTKPEVPEVSLVFDAPPDKRLGYNSLPCNQKEIHQGITSPSLEKHSNFPVNFYERSHSFPSYANTSNYTSCLPTFHETPNNLDDHNTSNVKKVSFSPLLVNNEKHVPNKNNVESSPFQRHDNTSYQCNDSVAITHHNQYTQRFTPDSKKTSCSCTSCIESCDYSSDHNSNYARMLKNLERKINTKVSFDDLQKTELKMENILLKHKCKFDKLGENCITREEFNRVIQKYENQINMLQYRFDELMQKFNSMSLCTSTTCNREIKKCSCTESQNHHSGNIPKEPISSGLKYSSHTCCPHNGPNINARCNHEMNRNSGNEVAAMSHDDRIIQKETRVDVQIAAPDKDMLTSKICHERCCNDENLGNIRYSEPLSYSNNVNENRAGCHQVHEYKRHSPKQNKNDHHLVPKSNSHEPVHNSVRGSSTIPSSYSRDHRQGQEIRNENQLQKTSDKNLLLDWTFYNNIVENVKSVIQQNTGDVARNEDTVDLIKKATMEQLQKMGINIENTVPKECHPEGDNHQKNKFNCGNSTSPDLSFRMNSLAMKYISDTPADGDLYGKKSGTNDISFRSNGNNVSIATLQYMERYQLLPSSEHRNGGNAVSHNKHEPSISQEHHHKLYKQTQNNDRSFIY